MGRTPTKYSGSARVIDGPAGTHESFYNDDENSADVAKSLLGAGISVPQAEGRALG